MKSVVADCAFAAIHQGRRGVLMLYRPAGGGQEAHLDSRMAGLLAYDLNLAEGSAETGLLAKVCQEVVDQARVAPGVQGAWGCVRTESTGLGVVLAPDLPVAENLDGPILV